MIVLLVAAAAGGIGGVILSRAGVGAGMPTLSTGLADVTGAAPEPTGAPQSRAPASAKPPPAAALTGLPSYPGATPTDLGDDIVAGGMPMAVAMFTTNDPAEDVMSYYETALEADHPKVVHEWTGDGTTGYVGWLDKQTGEMHGVVIVRRGRRTMVFPSVTAPGRRHPGPAQLPAYLPVPAHAEGTTTVSLGDQGGGAHQESVITTVPLASVAEVAAFYKKGFVAKGWQVRAVDLNSGEAARVVATRRDMRAEAYLRHVSGDGGGPRVEVYLILTTRAPA